jgi:hypothetical protein
MSSNRYQSRVFNFISQQSRKVADQLERGLRNLKFAAEGALQATLYPFYLLFQTARNFGNRLQQAGKENAPQIEGFVNDETPDYPETDTPIQRVLSFLQELPLPNFTPQPETQQIGGVSETNYPDNLPLTQPKVAAKGLAELSAFKELLTTATDTLNESTKTSNSPLLALGPAAEIPQSPISDRNQILALTNAVENTIVQLDKTANLGVPNLAIAPEITQIEQIADLSLAEISAVTPEIAQNVINRPQILGIATALATRNLILVATDNQTLDILTVEQQKAIQQKILSEVKSYYQQRQLAAGEIALKTDLQLVANQDHLIAPVRQLLRVMAWVQTSPIAVKVNLFDEANILRQQTNLEVENTNYQLPSSHKSYPSTTTDSPLLIPKLPFSISRFFTIPTPGTLQIQQPKETNVNQKNSEEKVTGVEEIEERIENVVESVLSAIDRFLGKDTQQKEQEIVEELYAQYKIPQPPAPEPQRQKRVDRKRRDRTTPTPSQNPNPLIREIPFSPGEYHPPQSQTNSIPPVEQEEYHPPQRQTKPIFPLEQEEYHPPQRQTKPIFPVPAEAKNHPYIETPEYKPPSRAVESANAQILAKVNPPQREKQQNKIVTTTGTNQEESGKSSAVNPVPDWWEAKVVSTGYVKHPLEQALESLDKAMLWLEEMGVQIWDWAKIQLEKILRSKN